MSLRPLLDKQVVKIDDHKRGNREIKQWDDTSVDVHIDKRTKYKINGRTQSVIIRIPVNSDRIISVEVNNNRNAEMPNRLYREIRTTLIENPEKANALANDIIDEINGYSSLLETEQKASAALNRLSKHFDLDWTKEKIATYVNDKLEVYTEIYTYNKQKNYYFSLNVKSIEISDITGWSKHEIRLKTFR